MEDLSRWERTADVRLADPGEIRPSEIFGLLRRFSQEAVLFAMACARNDLIGRRVRLYLEALQDVSPSITGRDLHRIGIPEGPAFGRILEEIRTAKLDGFLTSREEELELVRTMVAGGRGHGDTVMGDTEMGRWGDTEMGRLSPCLLVSGRFIRTAPSTTSRSPDTPASAATAGPVPSWSFLRPTWAHDG